MSVKLLIADDEDAVRCGLEKYVRLHTDRFGHIYTAENGQKAIDEIILHRPDIMLLDVRMPLKNGLDVMKEASRLGILPVTIIFSGYDEFKYAQQAIQYGAKGYLLKPTRSSEILELLKKHADELYPEQVTVKETDMTESCPAVIVRAQEYIKEHYCEDISAQQVANHVGITAGYLSTLLSQYCNSGFNELLNTVRMEHAVTYLQQNYLKTYEIAYKVGFRDEKYFSKVFKKLKGVTPGEYRKMNKENS